MESIEEIKRRLIADGHLSEKEIRELRVFLLETGEGMSIEKGNFLFDLKNSINLKHVHPSLKGLFVEAISALLLGDEDSPGEIDDDEAKWLRARIQANDKIDVFDRALLANLKQKSINFPAILNYKSLVTRRFEKTLYFTRYLTLLAVFGSLLSAIALFIKGSIIVVETMITFLRTFANPEYDDLLTHFVSSVDIFLFAMVLIIFGVGIYELFISRIDPVEQKVDGRPNWMRISSIDDLKSSLGKVILMVLIVTFFKYSIDIDYDTVNDLLKLGVGVVLVALALYITNKSHHE